MGEYSVRAGSKHHNRGGTVHKIEKIITHKGYGPDMNGHWQNDICLMRVVEPFVFHETRQPISLFTMDEATIPMGNGHNHDDRLNFPDELQLHKVPIISKEDCNTKCAPVGGIPDKQICAANPKGGKDGCYAAEGGPLAIDGRLAGVGAWGYDCKEHGLPGVYTEIAAYRSWIRKHANV